MKDPEVTDYQDFTTKAMPLETRRGLNVGDIWSNAAMCNKCGDKVRSHNIHDFRHCKCGAIAVDGGSWYARRIGELDQITEMVEMYDHIEE